MDGVLGGSLHPTRFYARLNFFSLHGHLARAHCLMVQCIFSGCLVSNSVPSCLEQEKLHREVCILLDHQDTLNEVKKTWMLALIFSLLDCELYMN